MRAVKGIAAGVVMAPPGPTDEQATEWLNACPACDQTGIAPFFWGRSHHGDIWYQYMRCGGCSLVFVNPRVPANIVQPRVAERRHRWSGHQFHEWYERKSPFDIPEFTANILRPLARLLPPRRASGQRRRWLDIGCATGNLLEAAHAAEYEPYGRELKHGLVEWAHEHRPHLHISQGVVADLPADATYDVISADNVLEHIHYPKAFLTDVRQRLSADGVVVIRVPNYDNIVRPLIERLGRLPTSYLVDPDAHPFNYSRRSLVALLGKTGFVPVRVLEHLMVSYPLKHILIRTAFRWPDRARRVLARLYPIALAGDRLLPRGGIDLTILATKCAHDVEARPAQFISSSYSQGQEIPRRLGAIHIEFCTGAGDSG
jgi:SAM-dependent methyltransferase